MREKIERLAKGIFEYEKPEIQLSEDKLYVRVAEGESFVGSFLVKVSSGAYMKGLLYSSCDLLVLETDKFHGSDNEISFVVHAEYARTGEAYQGDITIISDCGEVKLPFDIQILPVSAMSSAGEIRDLFQLAGLAQNDWEEARTLFFSDSFPRTILRDRKEDRTLYEQLCLGSSKDRALEEFLVSSKKKAPVHFKTDITSLLFERGSHEVMERINLWRESWGYLEIAVETEGDFFRVSQKRITSDNFTSGRSFLEVMVNFSVLPEGNHFGRITLRSARQSIVIPVTCRCNRTLRDEETKRKLFYETEIKLMNRYFDFRTGKMKAASYIAEAESLVELLLVRLQDNLFEEKPQSDKQMMYLIYRTYLELIAGKEAAARKDKEELDARLGRGELAAEYLGAYYYLEAMRQKTPAEVAGYAASIRELSERETANSWLLWFYIYTDKRREGGRLHHLKRIEEWFAEGKRSPFLYFEAALIWNEDPACLAELTPLSVHAMLFALEKKMLHKEVVLQASMLAMRQKGVSKMLLRCLMLSYDQFGQRDTLQAICTSLIADNERSRRYHRYFADACAAQLKLAGVQEYYIYTCGMSYSEQFDPSVLLFFTYDNELCEPYMAFLYAYIITNKESYPSFYRTYRKSMEAYTMKNILAGRIDEHLAVIYNEILQNSMIDGKVAAVLPEMIFSYRIQCTNPRMRSVAVLHKEEQFETVTPLVNGEATIVIYTEDARIVLLDEEGERFLPATDCTVSRLFPQEQFLIRCYELSYENRYLLLNLLEKDQNFRSVDVDVTELSKRVVRLDNLKEEFRQREIFALVKHSYDDFQKELLDSYLLKLRLEYLDKTDRNLMIELLILRGRYDMAVDAIARFGMEGVSPKRILMLCERMLLQCGGEQNDMLLRLCSRVFFDGQYNEAIVQYLVKYFVGATLEMYQVWLAATEYAVAAETLEERLLTRLLFAESYLPSANQIFFSYSNKRGNALLKKAYVSYSAFRYFVFDSVLQDNLIPFYRNEAMEGNEICKLALLKRLSEEEKLSAEDKQYAEAQMQSLVEIGRVFPFFSNFSGRANIPACMEDKVYVEYHTNPKHAVSISWLQESEKGEDFVTDEMRHIGYGFFVKEFILFYEEVLQYYITEDREDGPHITESFFRKMEDDRVHDETTKYGQINLILTAQSLQDEKTTIDMLENYYRMEYTMNRLFKPIKE